MLSVYSSKRVLGQCGISSRPLRQCERPPLHRQPLRNPPLNLPLNNHSTVNKTTPDLTTDGLTTYDKAHDPTTDGLTTNGNGATRLGNDDGFRIAQHLVGRRDGKTVDHIFNMKYFSAYRYRVRNAVSQVAPKDVRYLVPPLIAKLKSKIKDDFENHEVDVTQFQDPDGSGVEKYLEFVGRRIHYTSLMQETDAFAEYF